MGFFVLTGLLLLVAAIAVVVGNVAASEAAAQAERTGRTNDSIAKPIGWAVSGIAILLIILIVVFKSFHTVENGHIGIVKQFGSIVGTTGEGLVTTAPWQSIDEVSVRNEIREYVMDDRREGGSGSAVTKDTQPVFLDLVVNYSLVRAGAVPLYRETGGEYVERILDPAVYQVTKEVTAGYKATEFAANREAIRREIQEQLDAEVSQVKTEDGTMLEAININSVSLKNVDFTDGLSKAIEETVQREQEAKREEAAVRIKEAQADQAAAVAEGEARAARAKAAGAADAVKLAAQAEAYRVRQEGQALAQNPEVLRLRAIEKLNPNVQLIVPEDSTLVQGINGGTQVVPGG